MRERSVTAVEADRTFRWNSKIACRTLEETAFILFQSKMVSLNEVGTFVWERFRDGATTAEVVNSVVEEFDATSCRVSKDVGCFVEELLKRDLIQESFA